MSHQCAVGCRINPLWIHVLFLELITSSLVCSEIALHIVWAKKEDGQLMHLSFLKLKSALWKNKLFLYLLDMKETHSDIVLLMLFDLVFTPAFDALCALCVCVCVYLWICGHMPVSEWFDVSCLFCLYGLSFHHPFNPFHPFPACHRQMWTCIDCRHSNIKIFSAIFERTALWRTSMSQSHPDFLTKHLNKVIFTSQQQMTVTSNNKPILRFTVFLS